MASKYLLDTNIFIYYFNGSPVVQALFNEILTTDAVGLYCPITWVELLCYPDLSENESNQIRNFLKALTCVPLTEAVLDCAAQIRRDHQVKLPDALIAACALREGSILVTRNIRDFLCINELTILNPFDTSTM